MKCLKPPVQQNDYDLGSAISNGREPQSGLGRGFNFNLAVLINGTARFKNVNSCLNTNISSYLGTFGGKSHIIYLNVVHFFNTSVN